ncbi:hypothetical protein DYB32_005812 [Aphanomyces invadans]|uniref:Uncharacterized protein n=1 Tax=Aphanomyces invadans TaxID=157072 RepID=A0A3R6VKE9_9STRA|nr:hypothetical protein DYB32_005812 [Aphanomyces invadans]
MLLSIPIDFIVRQIHLRAEAELLLRIGDLGAELDNLLESTLEQASDYARCHSILKAVVQSCVSNSLYVTESVTRHSAVKGIETTNLTLLHGRINAALEQLAADQVALQRYVDMNRMFVLELEALGEASALVKAKSRILQVETILIERIESILTTNMPLSMWNPTEMWPDSVYFRDSQATHISETEHKPVESSSSSSSLFAATRQRGDSTCFDDNPIVH